MRHIIFILFWGLTTTIQASTPSVSTDSIHTLKHVLKIHLSYPDSAHNVLDEMEKTSHEPLFLLQAQRAMIYGAHNKHRLVIGYAQKALANDSLQTYPKYYMQTLSCCVGAYQMLHEHKKAIQLLEQALEFARAHKTSEANILFDIGQIYYLLNNHKEAYQYFAQAIRLSEEDATHKSKPFLSYFYGEMYSICFNEGKYKEALDYCNKREMLIHQMSGFKNIPHGYIDQQYAYLYSKKACVLSKLNRKAEADGYYKKFKETQTARSPQGMNIILPYWLENKQYQTAIKYLTQKDTPADTINQNYAKHLNYLAEAYQGTRQYDLAYQYLLRFTAIKDSLHKKEKKEEISELMTLYQLHEKEQEINQKKAEIQKTNLIRNWMTGALLLVCTLLWTTWHHLRVTQKKNRIMANSINMVQAFEEKIETLEKQISSQPEGSENEETDYQIFKRIERTIKDEKMFLKPDLKRQEILDRLNMDKNLFAKLMQQYLQMSLPQYLTELRVKYAIELLRNYPNYTIKAIADEAGFNNLRSFQRIFKSKTGMTPSEFKTAINQKG